MVLIKTLLCAAVLNRQQILLGTEDGLYCVDLPKNEFVKITDKKVVAIDIIDEPGLGQGQILSWKMGLNVYWSGSVNLSQLGHRLNLGQERFRFDPN